MPRLGTISVNTKLAKLELKRKILTEERNKELLDIISRYNAQILDDQLIVGFLIFATTPGNSKDPVLENFRKLAGATGVSKSGRRPYSKKIKL